MFKVYVFLLSVGLHPFVELNPIPEALASSKTMFYYKMNVTPPKNYDEWSRTNFVNQNFKKGEREMNIGYFGGSITEGYGASEDEFTYRALVTKHFDSGHCEINAGVGGTGSDLGAFRLQNDLLCKKPDFVFVEFAVNDSDKPSDIILRSMEGIVQQLLSYNSNIKIVFIYTLCERFLQQYINGEIPNVIAQHHMVAKYYNIPEINVGYELYKHLQESRKKLSDFLIDGCHPNDCGYAHYAETIICKLPEIQFDIAVKKPMNDKSFCNAKIVEPRTYAADGWNLSNETLYQRTPSYIYSNTVGSELVFEFTGSCVGLYFAIEKDSGNVAYSIDHGGQKEYQVWDEFAKIFNRANYVLLDSELEFGKHTLRVIVSQNKAEESEGYCIKIGGFLVC